MEKVGPKIEKQATRMRMPIPVDETLAVTLRYLATGESFESLMYQFRIHRMTIPLFVPKVCQAMYETLKEEYLNVPNTKEQWLELANGTYEKWRFPNAYEAIDSKHIALFHPRDIALEFYNYKGFYSLVLMATVDYNYKFVYVDVGCQGRISVGGVFRNTSFCKALENGQLNLPDPAPLSRNRDWNWEQDSTPVPFVFIGDDAFPLTTCCMKPYSQRNLTDEQIIFNFRASHYRRVPEISFGILASRFRLFLSRCHLFPENAKCAVLAAVCLHNMLREKSADTYMPAGYVDVEVEGGDIVPGAWRHEFDTTLLKPLVFDKKMCSSQKTCWGY